MPEARPVPHRRRRWPGVVVVLLILLGVGWAALWQYGAGLAERTVDGWRAREAKAGRVYNCATLTFGGFPFGFQVQCASAAADLQSNRPPLAVKTSDVLVSAHVWQPTVLRAEFTGPLTASEPGQAVTIRANWRQARSELHGLPVSPERVSLHVEAPAVDRVGGDKLFGAESLDLDGRMVSGTAWDRPVIEVVLKLIAASSLAWHPAAAIPTDADITAVLRGLKDFSPKPWPQRLRELQAANGRIEITRARVRQRDTVATASGVLGLSASGRLNGQLRVTIANLDQLLPRLGLDRMLSEQQATPELNRTFSALDRIMPGLGNVARQNAAPAIVAGIGLMGEPAELEGKRAVVLPLRFDDGMVSLGPLKIGMTPPLF